MGITHHINSSDSKHVVPHHPTTGNDMVAQCPTGLITKSLFNALANSSQILFSFEPQLLSSKLPSSQDLIYIKTPKIIKFL